MADKIKIVEVDDDYILFSDDTCLCHDHYQECCEDNFADFSQIDDIARNYEFTTPLKFELSGKHGFRFGDDRAMFYVPCYSVQNGYYSNDVEIYYGPKDIINIGISYKLKLNYSRNSRDYKNKYHVLCVEGDMDDKEMYFKVMKKYEEEIEKDRKELEKDGK